MLWTCSAALRQVRPVWGATGQEPDMQTITLAQRTRPPPRPRRAGQFQSPGQRWRSARRRRARVCNTPWRDHRAGDSRRSGTRGPLAHHRRPGPASATARPRGRAARPRARLRARWRFRCWNSPTRASVSAIRRLSTWRQLGVAPPCCCRREEVATESMASLTRSGERGPGPRGLQPGPWSRRRARGSARPEARRSPRVRRGDTRPRSRWRRRPRSRSRRR